jgi:hypothetical protein
LFLKANYPIYIYNTGFDKGFGNFGLISDSIEQSESKTEIPYDQGMQDLRLLLQPKDWDTIVYLDNDIFFDDIDYAEKLIKQFNESDFDFCSYFESSSIYKPEYKFNGLIAEVTDQKFEEVDSPPYTFYPRPHWENAFMMMKRSLWNKLTPADFIHSRQMLKSIFNTGAKMGVHNRESKLIFSHVGNGWFHVGNLMRYYYILENGNIDVLSKESNVDSARIGYFIAQRLQYGKEIYSDKVNENLDKACKMFGSENTLHLIWSDLRYGIL